MPDQSRKLSLENHNSRIWHLTKSEAEKEYALPSQSALENQNNSRLEPRLLRITEAAKYLGATCWFVRSRLWAGEIPFLRLGKRFLIDRADLDSFIDRQKSGAM